MLVNSLRIGWHARGNHCNIGHTGQGLHCSSDKPGPIAHLAVLVKVQKGPEMLAMMWRYASSVSLIESGGCSQHGMSCGPFLSGDSSIIFKHSKIKKEPCSLMCV